MADGLDPSARAELPERAAKRSREGGEAVTCEVVAFAPGCRPTDEGKHPGLGSSDQVAILLGDNDDAPSLLNRAYVLYRVPGFDPGTLTLDATLSGPARSPGVPSLSR